MIARLAPRGNEAERRCKMQRPCVGHLVDALIQVNIGKSRSRSCTYLLEDAQGRSLVHPCLVLRAQLFTSLLDAIDDDS
jgi:hypothetical protein